MSLRMIRLGQLAANGDASEYLIACLSGKEVPLRGMVEKPYVPGEKIIENYSAHLHNPNFYYMVEKIHVIQVLEKDFPAAASEIRYKYRRMEFLPFKTNSCEIAM